jgi:hypothetical protein
MQGALRWLTAGVAAVLVVVVAYLARGGTLPWRVTAAIVVAVAFGLAFKRWRYTQRAADTRTTIGRTVGHADPVLAQRALRAAGLVERTVADERSGSPELARAHFGKVLSEIDLQAVGSAADRRAAGYRKVALVLVAIGVLCAALDPIRLVEGYGVLLARNGRAPVSVLWLEGNRVTARFPRYLQLDERPVPAEGSLTVPAGTELVVRGRERHAGRNLVLSAGSASASPVLAPFVTDEHGEKVARITLMHSTALSIAARFGSVLVPEPRQLQVVVVPDEAPRVSLQGTPRQIKLSEMQALELQWRATDDHGLKQVDLVLRMGNREDRRPLARFDLGVTERAGAHNLAPNDPFLLRAFFPVSVTIEARDTNPDDHASWGKSDAFTIVPAAIGEPEALRYQALTAARSVCVAQLAELEEPQPGAQVQPLKQQAAALIAKVQSVLGQVSGNAALTSRLKAFITSQLESLNQAARSPKAYQERLQQVTLAIDAAARGLGVRDAQKVSIRLGDVAEEVAVGARVAQESERRARGVARVDEAMGALRLAQPQLAQLGTLGADLGGVLRAGLTRIDRVRGNEDLFHTELAALHLAARLRRPKPSFSSSSASGGGGGSESGAGGGSSPGENASQDDQKFEHLAKQLAELAGEHANNLKDVEQALNEALNEAKSGATDEEARERAQALRNAVAGLPPPGREPDSPEAAASLAREHANAMAQGIEGKDLQGAVESARDALSAFEQAQRKSSDREALQAELERGRKEVEKQLEWAKGELDKQRQQAAQAAREALQRAGGSEQELARRAQQLAGQDAQDVTLPEQARQRIAQAQGLMDEAASRLQSGAGQEALELQRKAQRLLEEANDEPNQQGREDSEPSASPNGDGDRGLALGGDVPGDNARARAEEFRRRVIEGLGRGRGGPLGPAIKRYAEGLLQ